MAAKKKPELLKTGVVQLLEKQTCNAAEKDAYIQERGVCKSGDFCGVRSHTR